MFGILKHRWGILNSHVCVLSRFSHIWLFATLWMVAHQAPLSMGFSKARILEWVAMLSSRGSSRTKDWTHVFCVSCITDRFFTTEPPGKPSKRYICHYFSIAALGRHHNTLSSEPRCNFWTTQHNLLTLSIKIDMKWVICHLW